MSKSIKPKDNTYWDSTGIVHSKTLLSTILAKIFNKTVGSTDRPTYFSSGEPKQCNTPASGNWFRGVPYVTSNGVMETGRYIDFHPTNASTLDYSKRIDAGTGTTPRVQTLPDLAGTFCVKQSATIATETNGWYKVDFGAFTMYYKNGEMANQSYAGNSWGWHSNLKLPSGITFNNAKMAFFGTERAGDSAVSFNCGCNNDSSYVTSCWKNQYGSAVTTKCYYNWVLIVFP